MATDQEQYDALLHEFPSITAPAMRGCGAGWFPLLRRAFARLEALGVPVSVSDIKEKYGTLRLDVDAQGDRVDAIVGDAEKLSTVTCELCGAPGKLRRHRPWLKTLCDAHAASTTKSRKRTSRGFRCLRIRRRGQGGCPCRRSPRRPPTPRGCFA